MTRETVPVYLLLGSNEGDRQEWIRQGIDAIAAACGSVTQQSALYETAAWGLEDQPDFLNKAIKIETGLSPHQLLKAIQVVEMQLGRQRTVKWGQRTLDIDILFYDDRIIRTKDLTIPHPFLQERRFALMPLQEIAPDLIHPVLDKTIDILTRECTDPLLARRLP